MCIYDDTIFACGASKRKLKERCIAVKTLPHVRVKCLPHIHWTYYSTESCADCGRFQREATGPVFGTESVIIAAGNACGDLRDSRLRIKRERTAIATELSESGDDEETRDSQDEWEWLGEEELLDVELDDVDRARLAEIDRSSSPEDAGLKKRRTVTFAPVQQDTPVAAEDQVWPDVACPNSLSHISLHQVEQQLPSSGWTGMS